MTARRPATARVGLPLAVALGVLVLAAAPAAAANPVLDPEDDAEIVEALAEASAVHDVCYGYVLTVSDDDTGIYEGTYTVTNAGAGVPPSRAECSRGSVLLLAAIRYVSSTSDSEDSASWRVASDLGGPSTAELERQGLSAGDLARDDTSATTLRNAVLALPALTAAQHRLPPIVLQPNTAPLPPNASATGSPGSDWLRESTGLLVLCALMLSGAVLAFAASFGNVRARARAVAASMSDAE